MKHRIIFALLLITYSTQCFAFAKKRSASFDIDKQGKSLDKKENQRFTIKVPTPRNISSIERRIAKIFSDHVIPIAQGLAQIAGGKEVETAREAKIKLREQKAQTALRSRTNPGRSRHASTPSSRGGGFGGSSWGGGGYRPPAQGGYSWGGGSGYRPTVPNWGQQASPSVNQNWGQSQSIPSYQSPGSSLGSGLTTTKATPFEDNETSKPVKKRKSSSNSKNKKLLQKRNSAIAAYKDSIRGMEEIIEKATDTQAALDDMQDFYKSRLDVINKLTEKFKTQEKAFKKLSEADKKTFTREYSNNAQAIALKFIPHLLGIILYPTTNPSLEVKQEEARIYILKNLSALVGVDILKKNLIQQDKDIEKYYKELNDVTITTATTAKTVGPIIDPERTLLIQLQNRLEIIANNFKAIADDSNNQLVEPTEVNALYKKIDALLQ